MVVVSGTPSEYYVQCAWGTLMLSCTRFAWQSSLERLPSDPPGEFVQSLVGLPSLLGKSDPSSIKVAGGKQKYCIVCNIVVYVWDNEFLTFQLLNCVKFPTSWWVS